MDRNEDPDKAREARASGTHGDEPEPDFARGERTTPQDDDVEPDFARGERATPQDDEVEPDFARGERGLGRDDQAHPAPRDPQIPDE